ncbi:hypothetical protein KGP25_26165 (plasmid) [Enterobacter sp. JBIWA003]|uniref:hypothetical protein n=1 Tax=Enterobacter sp. JBIWA003 TaxID=2831890 RepID=UPI001CBEE565|nr:hypothetical protein [Enterobacter sp. JBIWA003]UAN24988.1 hypothetical protein KGP25_26165 [Enterobacter sp. JBIWA003]
MLKKAKIYKVIISAISLYSFVRWGLDPDVICKIFSEEPRTCGYHDRGLIVNSLGTGFSILLTAMAVAILSMWIRKD